MNRLLKWMAALLRIGRKLPSAVAQFVMFYRPHWEYRIIDDTRTGQPMAKAELDALGKEGWELVAVIANEATTTTPYLHGRSWYFKRWYFETMTLPDRD